LAFGDTFLNSGVVGCGVLRVLVLRLKDDEHLPVAQPLNGPSIVVPADPASRFRVLGLGFEISGFGVGVSGSAPADPAFGFRVWVSGFGFRVSDFRFRVSGSGGRVSSFAFQISGVRLCG